MRARAASARVRRARQKKSTSPPQLLYGRYSTKILLIAPPGAKFSTSTGSTNDKRYLLVLVRPYRCIPVFVQLNF